MYSSCFSRRSDSVEILAVRLSILSASTCGNSAFRSLPTTCSSASNSTNAKTISSVVLGHPTSVFSAALFVFRFDDMLVISKFKTIPFNVQNQQNVTLPKRRG